MPRKSVVRLTDRPDMTLDVYRGRKTTIQHQQMAPSSLHQPPPDKGHTVWEYYRVTGVYWPACGALVFSSPEPKAPVELIV